MKTIHALFLVAEYAMMMTPGVCANHQQPALRGAETIHEESESNSYEVTVVEDKTYAGNHHSMNFSSFSTCQSMFNDLQNIDNLQCVALEGSNTMLIMAFGNILTMHYYQHKEDYPNMTCPTLSGGSFPVSAETTYNIAEGLYQKRTIDVNQAAHTICENYNHASSSQKRQTSSYAVTIVEDKTYAGNHHSMNLTALPACKTMFEDLEDANSIQCTATTGENRLTVTAFGGLLDIYYFQEKKDHPNMTCPTPSGESFSITYMTTWNIANGLWKDRPLDVSEAAFTICEAYNHRN